MRLFENILYESKREDAEYASMIQPIQKIIDRIGAEPFVIDDIKNFPKYLNDLKANLRRYDRIIPLIKSYRGYIAELLIQDRLGDMNPREISYLKAQADFHKEWRIVDHQKIVHYGAMFPMVPAMDRYVWQGKTPQQVVNDLEAIETKWKSTRIGSVRIRPEDKPIIEFPDGYSWVLLPRGGCPEEGEAMGHCGNGTGVGADRIYSLREATETDGEKRWKPRLTFIVHNVNGALALGEMKGRANTKPSPKYHDKIVALLKSDYVDCIRGGGYKPENNFSVFDLPVETRRTLIHKPKLWGMDAYIVKGKVDNFEMRKKSYLAVPDDKKIYLISNQEQRDYDEEVGIVSGDLVVDHGVLLYQNEIHLCVRDEVTSVKSSDTLKLTTFNEDFLKSLAAKKPHLWPNVYDVDHRKRARAYTIQPTLFYVPDINPENRFAEVGNGLYLLMEPFAGKVATVGGHFGAKSQPMHLGRELNRAEAEMVEKKTGTTLDPYFLPDEMVEERVVANPEYLYKKNIWAADYATADMFTGKTVIEGKNGSWVTDAPDDMYRYFARYNNGPLYIYSGNVILDDTSVTTSRMLGIEEFIELYNGSEFVHDRIEKVGISIRDHQTEFKQYFGDKVKIRILK